MPASGGGNTVSALPQEEEERTKIDCDHKLAKDENTNPIKRWDELKFKNAWDSAISARKNKAPGSSLKFPAIVSNHLEGPPDMQRDKNTETNNCISTVECSNDLDRTPALALILRGFIKVSKV